MTQNDVSVLRRFIKERQSIVSMNDQHLSDTQTIEEVAVAQNEPKTAEAEPFPETPETALAANSAETSSPHRHIFMVVGVIVLLLDQLSKWYVVQNIPLNSSHVPLANLYPYFQFSHVANTGATFGLFSGGNRIFIMIGIVAASAIVYYNYKSPPEGFTFHVALGLVFGGIVGNFIDRIRLGHVTDFIDFNLRPLLDIPIADWYVFNIADLALVSGVILLFILSLKDLRQSQQVTT